MTNKEFKKAIGKILFEYGFMLYNRFWVKEYPETIIMIYLQRSSYSHLYYLHIEVFVRGIFGVNELNKDLVKQLHGFFSIGDIKGFEWIFDFEEEVDDQIRMNALEDLFKNKLFAVIEQNSTIAGIKKHNLTYRYKINPLVNHEIDKLNQN